MPDQRGRPGQQRHRGRDLAARLDVDIGGAGSDPQRRAVSLDALQSCDAGDVDQVLEHREPQRQHRHEALASGKDLCSVTQLRQHRHCVVSGVGSVVLEGGRLHRAPVESTVALSVTVGYRGGVANDVVLRNGDLFHTGIVVDDLAAARDAARP